MAAESASDEFAVFLASLKRRSGHSYVWLSRRCHVSKSTLHRYCNGQALPRKFGTAEQIALACDADREELDWLYRLWGEAMAMAVAGAKVELLQAPSAEAAQVLAQEIQPEASAEVADIRVGMASARTWTSRRRVAVVLLASVAFGGAVVMAVMMSKRRIWGSPR